jgi:DHA1 family tetracycline resistance protein-like MFS transporter
MFNPTLLFILFTVMINMTGVGLIWPILPSIVERLTGGTVAEVAVIYGALAVAFSITQFLFAPVLGALSDRVGRRPVMLVALGALGVDMALIAFAPSIFWVFVARILGGAFAATLSIASASIADMMEPKDRAAGFGLIGAAFGLGFIVGPLAGGVLGGIDPVLPFLAAAALSFANVAFGYFFLKETLPAERRSSAPKRTNPFSALAWILAAPSLLPLTIALLVATTIQRGLESIWVLFTAAQLGWDVREAGVSLAVVGLCFVVVQGFLVGRVTKRVGERTAMIGGFLVSAAVYVLLAFNTSSFIGYVGIIPHVLGWGIATPALQAIASRATDAQNQGLLQGSLSGIQGLSAIMGPMLSSASFAYFTSAGAPVHFPGAFFLLGTFALLAAAWLGARSGSGAPATAGG